MKILFILFYLTLLKKPRNLLNGSGNLYFKILVI